MRAVIYARFSDGKQKEESIDVQLRECKAYAKKRKITIVGEYIDKALTGRTDKRPNFLKMIKDSAKNNFDAVITLKVDRFARNRYDSALYKAKLKQNNVHVVYARESIPDGPEGILLESMLEGYAEYYSANLRQNVLAGLHENALNCKVTGSVPFGYKVSADHTHEIDPIAAPIVREVFEKYSAGEKSKEIIDYLARRGIKTKSGKAFDQNAITRMLKNKKYYGLYKYMDVEIEGGIPPIISKKLFEEVQEKMARTKTSPGHKTEYLLTTKLICGHCESFMVGESGRSKNGNTYYYYKCAARKKNAKACDKAPVRKEYVEKLVTEITIKEILNDDIIRKIIDKVIEIQDKDQDIEILSAMQSRLGDVEKSIKNLMKAIESGIITETTKNRLTELENEQEDIKNEIEIEKHRDDLKLKPEQLEYWLKQFQDGDPNDVNFQKKIIDLFVHKVYLYDDEIRIYYNLGDDNDPSEFKRSDQKIDESSQSVLFLNALVHH